MIKSDKINTILFIPSTENKQYYVYLLCQQVPPLVAVANPANWHFLVFDRPDEHD